MEWHKAAHISLNAQVMYRVNKATDKHKLSDDYSLVRAATTVIEV